MHISHMKSVSIICNMCNILHMYTYLCMYMAGKMAMASLEDSKCNTVIILK